MKSYLANDELSKLLLANGFIETTSQRDKIKGKKSFKLSKNAAKEIHFDYSNIKIYNSIHGQENTHSLTEEDLKFVLFYFKHATDFKELESSEGEFKFKAAHENLIAIEKELEDLTKFNLKKLRRNKLTRIVQTYNQILLN